MKIRTKVSLSLLVLFILAVLHGCSPASTATNIPNTPIVKISKLALIPRPLIERLEIVIDEPAIGDDYVLPLGDQLIIRVHCVCTTRPDSDRTIEAQIDFTLNTHLYDVTGLIVSGDVGIFRKHEQPITLFLEVPIESGSYRLEIEVVAFEPSGVKTRWSKIITLKG